MKPHYRPKKTTKDGKSIQRLRTKKKLPHLLARNQLLTLLHNVTDIRMAVIVFMGVFQGLRIGEMVRLKWKHIDLEYGDMKIVDGKNTVRYKSGYGKDRIIPIYKHFLPVYKMWRTMNLTEEYVIPTDIKSKRAQAKHLIRDYQQRFKKLLEKCDLLEIDYMQKNNRPRYTFHPHTLRHVCGTNLYRCGMDIYQIKEYLGHEDIEDTMVYVALGREDLREASHVAYSYPKSRLGYTHSDIEVSIDPTVYQSQNELIDKKIHLAQINRQIMAMEAFSP